MSLGNTRFRRDCPKNWQSIHHAENAELVAVASRDLAKSKDFINRCSAQVPHINQPMALGSYEELLSRDDIDAIYLPLPTGLRPEWALKVAEAGKHLLCEKPCGTSLEQVQDIVAACDRAGVQFMDGVMFMHSERLKRVRAVLMMVRPSASCAALTLSSAFVHRMNF